MWVCLMNAHSHKTKQRTKTKKVVTKIILDVGMEKEQKQELGWRVSVLPIPAFHHCEMLCVTCTQCTVECK